MGDDRARWRERAASELRGADPDGLRAEFVGLARSAQSARNLNE